MPPRRAKTHLTKEDAVKIAKPDHLSSADESAALRQSQPCLAFFKALVPFCYKDDPFQYGFSARMKRVRETIYFYCNRGHIAVSILQHRNAIKTRHVQ
jgi:hypothetical protein